jgi:host factor-I protein
MNFFKTDANLLSSNKKNNNNKKNKLGGYMAKNDLQEDFLSHLQKTEETVAVFLINGIKLHGVIDKFDEHVLFLKNAVTQMVYKHAISTVVPASGHHHKSA